VIAANYEDQNEVLIVKIKLLIICLLNSSVALSAAPPPANSLKHYHWSRSENIDKRMRYDFEKKQKYSRELAKSLTKKLKNKGAIIKQSGDLITIKFQNKDLFRADEIRLRYRKAMAKVARATHRFKDLNIHIATFSKSVMSKFNNGSYYYEKRLTDFRAKSIYDYLIRRRVQLEQLTFTGYGGSYYRPLLNQDVTIIAIQVVTPYEKHIFPDFTYDYYRVALFKF